MARRWWRRDEDDASAASLVAGCEAFLTGTYVEYLSGSSDRVPVWAWVNLLAHGTEPELRRVERQRPADPWFEARRFLVGELLDRVDDGGRSLAELQRTLLVPLEFDLADAPATRRWRPGGRGLGRAAGAKRPTTALTAGATGSGRLLRRYGRRWRFTTASATDRSDA